MHFWWQKKKLIPNFPFIYSVFPRSTRYLPCTESVAINPPLICMGPKMELRKYLRLNSISPTVSSAQAISNAIANRLCLQCSCLMLQKTVDFMLFISVPVQMQLLSTERLLANEHSSSNGGIAFTWCFLWRRSRLHCHSVHSILSPCDFMQKRVKKAAPSLRCSNRLFYNMVLMYWSCSPSFLSCPPLPPTFQSQIEEVIWQLH